MSTAEYRAEKAASKAQSFDLNADADYRIGRGILLIRSLQVGTFSPTYDVSARQN